MRTVSSRKYDRLDAQPFATGLTLPGWRDSVIRTGDVRSGYFGPGYQRAGLFHCPFGIESTRVEEPGDAAWRTVVIHEMQSDLIYHRVLPDPLRVKHRRVGPICSMTLMPGRGMSRQEHHPTRRYSATRKDIRWRNERHKRDPQGHGNWAGFPRPAFRHAGLRLVGCVQTHGGVMTSWFLA
jgi:hypothetical protein